MSWNEQTFIWTISHIFIHLKKKTERSTAELQESIIQKIRHTSDEELLNYLNQLLNNEEEAQTYKLSEFERNMLAESKADYLAGKVISNEDVISRNEEWLKE